MRWRCCYAVAMLLCGGGVLSNHRSCRGQSMIERLGPRPEGLELRVSVVAKVVSKGWGSVTLSPRYERALTPPVNSCCSNALQGGMTHTRVPAGRGLC